MNLFRTTVAAAAIVTGTFAANAASAYERWLDVVNNSNFAVYSVYMTHVGIVTWGRDLLGNDVIQPGYQMRVEPDYHQGYCRFDILVVYEDGYEQTFWRVNLCEETTLNV